MKQENKMQYDYRESVEGKRRFDNPKIYELSLEFQRKMGELGAAWHNHFANECTIDFCCCEGDNILGSNYKHYIPSFRSSAKQLFEELFEEIKHGDEEHQQWLKNKMDQFIKKLD